MKTAERTAALSAGGQLKSLSIVSISSSSDPSYRMTGMVRGELWQLPQVLKKEEKHVNNMKIIVKKMKI